MRFVPRLSEGRAPCSKPMFFHTIHADVLVHVLRYVFERACSTEENPLFDFSFGGAILPHPSGKTKTDYKVRGEVGGRTPADLHLPFHGLCGALCYTENSTTAKLDFDKRHRDTEIRLFQIISHSFLPHDHSPEMSLQVVLFLVSLGLCFCFCCDFSGRSRPWTKNTT